MRNRLIGFVGAAFVIVAVYFMLLLGERPAGVVGFLPIAGLLGGLALMIWAGVRAVRRRQPALAPPPWDELPAHDEDQ